jgi:hypothetical protein
MVIESGGFLLNSFDEQLKRRLPKSNDVIANSGWRKDQAYSAYFHYIQMLHCTAVPQPPGHPRRVN